MSTQRAFSLLEFMIVVALVATLTALAVPAFSDLIYNQRQVTAINNFVSSIYAAKSEAAKRVQEIVLCASSDGFLCEPDNNWDGGWIVFSNVDGDNPPQIDAEDDLISVNTGLKRIYVTSNRHVYIFRPYYRNSTNGTVVFCDDRGDLKARAIIISPTGRPRISTTYADGDHLTCDH